MNRTTSLLESVSLCFYLVYYNLKLMLNLYTFGGGVVLAFCSLLFQGTLTIMDCTSSIHLSVSILI